MFEFEFMRIAFIVGILLSIIIPLLGQTLVIKRLSMSGDALSHTALAGVAIGLVAGLNPLYTAIILAVVASLIIELIRKKFSKYAELSVSIVLATSIGIAGILSQYTSSSSFTSYLFGSIILINKAELILTIIIFILVLLFYIVFYNQIKYSSYNELSASLDKVNVRLLNICHTVLTAVVIAISSKTIGSLMVSALMVIPYAASIQVSKSYKNSMIFSVLFSLISVILGLIISYYLSLAPGATIVLISVVILIITMILNQIFKFNK